MRTKIIHTVSNYCNMNSNNFLHVTEAAIRQKRIYNQRKTDFKTFRRCKPVLKKPFANVTCKELEESSRQGRQWSATSRERPKSAPYLKLKNSKRTSKCLSLSLLQYPKNTKVGPNWAPGPASAYPWRAKRGTFSDFSTFLSQNIKKTEWTTL